MDDDHPQIGGEFLDLPAPVLQQRGGTTTRLVRPFSFEPLKVGQHLDRLAEAHVIGQANPEAQRVQEWSQLRPCCWYAEAPP